jgi:hypothetical protein
MTDETKSHPIDRAIDGGISLQDFHSHGRTRASAARSGFAIVDNRRRTNLIAAAIILATKSLERAHMSEELNPTLGPPHPAGGRGTRGGSGTSMTSNEDV